MKSKLSLLCAVLWFSVPGLANEKTVASEPSSNPSALAEAPGATVKNEVKAQSASARNKVVGEDDEYVFVRKHLGEEKNKLWLKIAEGYQLEDGGKLGSMLTSVAKIAEGSVVFLPAGSYLHIESDLFSEIWIEGPAKFKLNKLNQNLVDLNFLSGSLRFRKAAEDSLNVALSTPLWKTQFGNGDRLVTWDPGLVLLRIVNFENEFKFKIEDREEVLGLGAQTKASFQGRLEDGEIVYDVLLKGEKVPRGTFSSVVPISSEEKKGFTVDAESKFQKAIQKITKEVHQKKQEKAKVKKASAEAVAKQNPKSGPSEKKLALGIICSGPDGKFNDCAWRCIDKKTSKNSKATKSGSCEVKNGFQCVRERCFADGSWGDRQPLSSEAGALICKAATVVKVCDY